MRNAILTLLLFGLLAHANPAAFYGGLTAARLRGTAATPGTSILDTAYARWTFDGDWADSIGSLDATPQGAGASIVSQGQKQGSGAALFDGAGTSWAAITGLNINGWTGITISAWIYETNRVEYAGTLMSRQGATLYRGTLRNTVAAPGQLTQFVIDNHISTGTVPTNTWTHLVVTWAANGKHQTYFNGVFDSQTTTDRAGPISWTNTSWQIGADIAIASRRYRGLYDDLAIFDYGMTSNQVAELHAAYE